MSKEKYYRLTKILKENADYNIIIGERSNGKTYACLEHAIEDYFKNGSELAIVRRWKDDFTGKRGTQMFSALVNNDVVTRLSNGKYTRIVYNSSRWYFGNYDEKLDKVVCANEPFAYAFAISMGEHDKSISFPKIRNVVFDEFLTRKGELVNEFVEFMNIISTIARDRDDVKVFMCGNVVNLYSSYFREMGLKHIKDMKKGTIDVYTYGDSKLKVAVEYCDSGISKASDKYFAFDNPRLKMITGGMWEIGNHPHLPYKYLPKDIVFIFFIVFENEIFQCEVIEKDNDMFIYIHIKTTPLKDNADDLIYSQEFSSKPNYRRKITIGTTPIEKNIQKLFSLDKVFYQDNEVGNAIVNYIQWCKSESIGSR